MPRILTYEETCQVELSILDHLDALKAKVSPNALAESHSICSAAGAIFVANTFTQSNGTVTIENSSAKFGGAVHLGASFWESFEMLLELALRLWYIGSF